MWLKTKIFQLFGQQSLYDIMNWHTYGNSWEKLYFQQLFDNIWRLPVGRSLQRAEQPHLLHRASIIPAIARREFKFQTMVLLQLNSYYGGGVGGDYVTTRKQHVRSLNPQESQVAGQCRRCEPSVCPASNMSTITGRTAIIFGTLKVPRGGNLFLMMSRLLFKLFPLV